MFRKNFLPTLGVVFLISLLLPYNIFAMPGAAQAPQTVTGKVAETMNSGGYTYMLVERPSGEQSRWVAIPESKVEVGSTVDFYAGMVMQNFSSKTLNRTFDTIIFSPGLANSTTMSPHATTHKAKDSFAAAVEAEKKTDNVKQASVTTQEKSGGSLGAIVPFEDLTIEKAAAANSHNVDEIFTGAEKLNGQEITIRGKVVKFSPMIMGRNWVHIQDGTGNAMKNQHDLVITTQDTVQEGEIILAQGTVAANKDFGAGYRYDVIIEKASLTVE